MSTRNIGGPQVKKARMTKTPPMTQEQLSIQLQIIGWDIDRFGISKIERCERQVTDKVVILLSEALSVLPSQLLATNNQ